MGKLGIIQSRGLGDIIIALPIADYYRQQGWEIYWPITDSWVPAMSANVPWVKWIPVVPDQKGLFFYDSPMERLKNFEVDEVLCLYQSLTGHPEFTKEPWFQHCSFDRYKYYKAGVPFHKKWTLESCLTRQLDREQALYDKLVKNPNYVVTHLQGSTNRVKLDPAIIPEGWDVIDINNHDEGWIFDWIKIIEGAQAVIMIDSCMANLVDQLDICDDRYFIPRSHIQLTPVLGGNWAWLENPDIDAGVKIFSSR